MHPPTSTVRARRKLPPWLLLGFLLVPVSLWFALAELAEPPATDPGALAAGGEITDAPSAAGEDADPDHAADPRATVPDGLGPSPGRVQDGAPVANPERWSAGVVTGRVLGGPGASEPIGGIVVRASAPRSTVPIAERRTRTDASGRYAFRDLVAARWEIEASLPAFDLRGASFVVLDEKERPEAEIDVALPYERHVEVRLVDARGNSATAESMGIDPVFLPLVCVAVAHACKDHGTVLGPADMPLNRVVDKSPKGERHTFDVAIQAGGAECLHALFGDRVVASRAIAREDARVDFVLDAADFARFLGPCALEVVRHGDGTRLGGGWVSYRLPGAVVARDLGPDGTARLEGVPFGAVRATVEVPGYVTRVVTVDVPATAPLRVEMLPARRIAGRIAIEGGRDPGPYVPGLWRVRDPSQKLGEPDLRLTKRAEGAQYAFESLEPGIYVVAAVPGSLALHTAEDVRVGNSQGAVWIDLTQGDARGVDLFVPAWMDP